MTAVQFRNPVITDNEGADHGDPFVMKHLETYYLYHTGRAGVHLYTSADLVGWEYRGLVLQAAPVPGHWAQTDFWAPEVICCGGTFYMYVTATPKRPDGRGDDDLRRLGLARAASPLGPFVWDPQPLIGEWSNDGHPFRDENGDTWLFYNIRNDTSRYWDGTIGCGNVVERLPAPDRLEGSRSVVSYPDRRWEGDRDGTWYWNEGPCVRKRRGLYYQMYSGGCYADDTYAIGFSTAPAPTGPWTKYPGNPVLRSGPGVLGPGHHSVVVGPDGVTPWVFYHAYVPGERGRKVFMDRLFWAGDRLVIAGPTGGEQERPGGPEYDPAVPHRVTTAWVTGPVVTVSGIPLALGPGVHLLKAAGSRGRLRVWIDGVARYAGEGGPEVELAADGVEAVAQTSHLDDDGLYELPHGAPRVWAWGGTAPLDLSVAVRGRVTLEAGGQRLEVDAVGDRFALVRLRVPGGAAEVRLTGGPGGATVADLVLTALAG